MAEKSSGWTWFKYGCIGCLGFVVLLIAIGAAVGLAAKRMADSTQTEARVLTPKVPRPAPQEAPGGAGAPTTQSPPLPVAGAAAGRVVLNLSGADVEVRPAGAGTPLRVEADFDPVSYALTEKLETADDGTWVYTVSFHGEGGGFLRGLAELLGGKGPKLTVFLPADTPIEIDADVTEGGVELELGGLWLVAADLRFERGAFDLDFSEPLREPMERLTIHGSMGGFNAESVGNASPRVLDVDLSMGGMNVDLTGVWRADSAITLRTSMGGGAVELPENVAIEGLPDDPARAPATPGSLEVPLPVLRFTEASRLDDIEIR